MFPQQFQNKITTGDEPHVKNEDKQNTAIVSSRVPSSEEGGGEPLSDGPSMLDPLYYHYICSTLFETL
jgi:hypothetical protein